MSTLRGPAFRYGSAVVAITAATLVRLWLDPTLQDTAPFSTYYMAIMFTAWYGGLGPALLAIPCGAALADSLFIEPRGSILSGNPEHQVGLILYVCVGIVVAALSESLHASRRRAEIALLQLADSEEKLRTVADFTYDWEYWVGPDENPVWTSPSCRRITGYAAEEFLADRSLLERITHPEDRARLIRHVAQVCKSREPSGLEFRIITRQGETRWIEHVCQPVFDKRGNFLGRRVSNRDATGRKEAEETIRCAQEELLLAQQQRREQVEAELAKVKNQLIRQTRLAAIGQVSASIAHDLRNPLAALGQAAYLVKRHLPQDPPKCLEYLDMMGHEMELMNRIIGNLMEMAHGKQPQKAELDLGKLVSDVFDRVEHDDAIHLQMHCEPQPFVVAADPVQLRQVLANLLANAIQAMPQGGRVWVGACRSGSQDTIVVEDDGPGIPPEIRGQIFEPLVTSKPKGTGLGLAICRQIVERHGGTIELLATDRPGAAFEICLPSPNAAPKA